MKKNHNLFSLPLIAAFAVLAAIVLTTPAFAQDEVPPVPEEAPAKTEVEVPAEDAWIEEIAPLLEEAAEAGVVLADENGEPLALAEMETAEALAGGDPWYKVGTRRYLFLRTGSCPDPLPADVAYCEVNPNPIMAAINYLKDAAHPNPTDGIIHVEEDTYGDFITIDAAGTPKLATLKGLIGVTDPATQAPLVNLGGRISVQNCSLGFTVIGFNIDIDSNQGALNFNGCKGTIKIEDVDITNTSAETPGIFIDNHNGAVTITRARVNGNVGGGALIDNTLGTYGVTITNSSFSNNTSNAADQVGGLTIITRGPVSLTGVTAFGNTGGQPGVFIQQSGAITVKDSVFSGNAGFGISNYYDPRPYPTGNISLTNVFADGNWRGMELYTKGAITLSGVSASGNPGSSGNAAYLETCLWTGTSCELGGTGTVTIKNSFFDENNNSGNGLSVNARGAITLTSVSASRNASGGGDPRGAYLVNSGAPTALPVKVTLGWFDGNDYTGLFILSKGAVSVSRVSASDNRHYGIMIGNTAGTTAGVSISGLSTAYSQFTGNYWQGISIASRGAVTLKYVNCSDNYDWNSSDGASIDNHFSGSKSGVTITSSLFNRNPGTGLLIESNGAIKLSAIEASDNDGDGIYLRNETSPSYYGITLSNILADGNTLTGIDALSAGPISLSSGHANLNSEFGVNLVNQDAPATAPKPVTIKNFTANQNSLGGVGVTSKGSITLSGVTVYSTLGAFPGIALDNLLSGSITLSNVISSNNNSGGIDISSFGAIKLSNIEASYNGDDGIYLRNETSPSYAGITLTNIKSDGNDGYGIDARSAGAISLSGGHANANQRNGVFFDNSVIPSDPPKSVSIKNFTANASINGGGIFAYSLGPITASNLTANGNLGAGLPGIYLQNVVGTAGITASKLYASGNSNHTGISIFSSGAVKLSTAEASRNGFTGISINTPGSITLSNAVTLDNGGEGALLDNTSSTTHAPVTVTGSTGGNIFSGNAGVGLGVMSLGAVALKNIAADHNFSMGIHVENYQAGNGLGNITAATINTGHNLNIGLSILTNGTVSLSSIKSMLNSYNGMTISSNHHNITISNSVAISNRGSGIAANVGHGLFTLYNTLYFGNDIDNTGDPNLFVLH